MMVMIGIYPEWNVNFFTSRIVFYFIPIGIYPEWNVNLAYQLPEHSFIRIGIYPEWNVNLLCFSPASYHSTLEYIQNGM